MTAGQPVVICPHCGPGWPATKSEIEDIRQQNHLAEINRPQEPPRSPSRAQPTLNVRMIAGWADV